MTFSEHITGVTNNLAKFCRIEVKATLLFFSKYQLLRFIMPMKSSFTNDTLIYGNTKKNLDRRNFEITAET